MNITPQSTTVADNTQEVLLRTLASDIASLEHGSQIPTAQHLTARFSPEADDTSALAAPKSHHTLHTVLVILFLALVGAGIYFYIYPRIMSSFAPAAV